MFRNNLINLLEGKNMISVKIIIIGHLRHQINFRKIKQTNSDFFKIDSNVEEINNLPNPQKNDGYCDVSYSKTEITDILKDVSFMGIVVGIMNERFDDNFYMHRVGDNKVCISLAGIDNILLDNNISLENFIIKNIYEIIVLKKAFSALNEDDIYSLHHLQTRKCLFDMNGDKYDVIHNTEKPKICNSCKSVLNEKSLPSDFINKVEKELKKIKKTTLCSIRMNIKKRPILAVFLSLLSGFFINILASGAWDLLKKIFSS
jgi:hypothetical protein